MSIVIRCFLLQCSRGKLLISHLGFSLLLKNQPLNYCVRNKGPTWQLIFRIMKEIKVKVFLKQTPCSISDMGKHELRITSCELKVTS